MAKVNELNDDIHEMYDIVSATGQVGWERLKIANLYADLLQKEGEKLGNLTTDQKMFLDTIVENAKLSQDLWLLVMKNLQRRYISFKIPDQIISISDVLFHVQRNLAGYPYIEEVRINVQENLPAIKCDLFSCAGAISYIIKAPPTAHMWGKRRKPFSPSISISQSSDTTVLFEITTDLVVESDNRDNIFYPSGYLATARLFLEQYNCELKVAHLKDGSEFQSALPTVESV